jgi:pimeloyl-ACP methyl ester carboxylesterase
MTIETAQTRHAQIAVRRSAGRSALPVVMIHGNSSSGEIFRNQFDGEIGRTHSLIALDLPGHGASSDARDPERTYSMPGYAEAMVEALEKLEIERAIVFGWSLGGHIGLEMISRFPGLVGLMITGTPPVGHGAEALAAGFREHPHMASAGKEHLTPEEIDSFAHATCGDPFEPFLRAAVARTDGRARRLMFESFAAGRGDDQSRIVASARTPLAVVNGAREPFVNLGYVSGLAYANLWEGRTHEIADSGHAPFWDAPAAFDLIFSRFVADMNAIA